MAERVMSTEAVRLLAVLREHGATARAPIPDWRLAELTSLPARRIIDAARELLNAGIIVLANGRGRWIGALAEAIAYRASNVKRLRNQAGRISAIDVAIRAHGGQLELPFEHELAALGVAS